MGRMEGILYLDEGQSPEITIQMQQKSPKFDLKWSLLDLGLCDGLYNRAGPRDNDEFSHSVTLEQDVLMGKYEVTVQGLYEQYEHQSQLQYVVAVMSR